jgi:hypothetical protein
MFDFNNKNIIYYGTLSGIIEHIIGIIPRSFIDYLHYYDDKSIYKKQIKEIKYRRLLYTIMPSITGITLGHIWLFNMYENSKNIKNKKNIYLKEMLYGMIGKLGHDIFITPGEIIRMRSNILKEQHINIIKDIYNKNGIKGFYIGLIPSLLINIPNSMIEFCLILNLNKYYGHDNYKPFIIAYLSSMISNIICSPIDTIKTNIQLNYNNKISFNNNIFNIYNNIKKNRGYIGFFRGIHIKSLQSSITYGSYIYLSNNYNLNLIDI